MNPRMLIVDDEENILRAVGGYFELRGFQVDCACELEDAEKLLDRHAYDIVLADLRLTGINGVEGLEIVSYVREKRPHAKTVLLTAYGTAEIREEAIQRGADAFLHKPQPLAEIARIVDSLLGSALATDAE